MNVQLPISPQEWLRQMFSTRAAIEGGVIRRKVSDIDRIVGREAFMALTRKRGFRVVENAGHFVIFCNAEDVHIRL